MIRNANNDLMINLIRAINTGVIKTKGAKTWVHGHYQTQKEKH